MMVKAFLEFVRQNKLIDENDNILLGVSGGSDSMVMADLFKKAGYDHAIAHCNFGLRGEEADRDEGNVKEYSLKANVPFYSKQFDTRKFADQNKISSQMAARELRYKWFRDLSKDHGFKSIAIAHHKDDQAETIVFNLIKGTGIAGLTGWKPKDRDIIRPLLFAIKNDILDYARSARIKWVEDSSNESTKYLRNKIRREIMPLFKEINPGFLSTLEHTLSRLRETETSLKSELKKLEASNSSGEDTIILKEKISRSNLPTLALYHILKDLGFNYRQCVDIWSSFDESGKMFMSDDHVLNIDRETLVISAASDPDRFTNPISINSETATIQLTDAALHTRIIREVDLNKISPLSTVASLDLDKLSFPLTLRLWQEGDHFVPLGMKGKKKLSDFMIDEKIPVNLKRRLFIIESGNDIAWVVGYRIDDRFKITAETSGIFEIKYEKNRV